MGSAMARRISGGTGVGPGANRYSLPINLLSPFLIKKNNIIISYQRQGSMSSSLFHLRTKKISQTPSE